MGDTKQYNNEEWVSSTGFPLHVSPTRPFRDSVYHETGEVLLARTNDGNVAGLIGFELSVRYGSNSWMGAVRALQALVYATTGTLPTIDVIWNPRGGEDTVDPEGHIALIRVLLEGDSNSLLRHDSLRAGVVWSINHDGSAIFRRISA